MRGAALAIRVALLALLASALLLLAAGESPFHILLALVNGAFGTRADLARTLAGATPLIFAGLAVALPFRAGLFNIGAEGQLILAGLAAGVAGAALSGLPPVLLILATVLLAVLVGATWATIAGVLRARLGIHEVIVTILLNFIAVALASYVLHVKSFGLVTGMEPKTPDVPECIQVGEVYGGVGGGLVFAVVVAILMEAFLFRTRPGLALRALGGNPRAAEAAGVRAGRVVVLTMALAGGLAALAGAQQVLEAHGSYLEGFSPGYGFTGIAVALLGANRPLGVVFAALFFAVLRSGAFAMDALAGIPRETIGLVEVLVILLVASDRLRDAFRAKGGAA